MLTDDTSPDSNASVSMRSIVGGPTQGFFKNVWQKSCRVYRANHETSDSNNLLEESPQWNEYKVRENPFDQLVQNGWFALVAVLEQARSRFHEETTDDNDPSIMLPLVFCEQQALPVDRVQSTYSGNLFSAYLDGCSIVLNHADWLCPYMAALCLDLQKSFPHAYANAYLTPPSSRAVPPHADDRDVLVIQLVGEKQWNVYENIPIPVSTNSYFAVFLQAGPFEPERLSVFSTFSSPLYRTTRSIPTLMNRLERMD